MTWSASADERPATYDSALLSDKTSINVDSLYTAKTQEVPAEDSSYVTALDPEKTISGRVSWYGPGFHGRRTASGERFDRGEMTAAHKTLPFGSLVRVIDQATGKSVLVRINDRGPYCGGRVLDLSEAAASRLGIKGRGTASARLEIYSIPSKSRAEQVVNTSITFDIDGRAIKPHGYSVTLTQMNDFEEAIAEQHRLQEQGHENVFLTRVREAKETSYRLSLGLFSTEHLCGSLLAEVADKFKNASIVRLGENETQLASTPVSESEI
jgi:rare lipoprotein A